MQNAGVLSWDIVSIVSGTNIDGMIQSVKELNEHGIACTIDILGEFMTEEGEAMKVKEQDYKVIESIHENNVGAHISLNPTQVGLDINNDFCLNIPIVGLGTAAYLLGRLTKRK